MPQQLGISLINAGYIVVCVAVCLGLLFGCDKDDPPATIQNSQTSAEPTGLPQLEQPVIQHAEALGDGTVQTVNYGESGDDQQITYGGDDVDLPDGWPEFLEIYQSAKLLSSQLREEVTGPFLVVGFETQDQIDLPMEFYEKLLLNQGYKLTYQASVEGHMTRRFSSQQRGVEIACHKEELRNVVYVSTWILPGS